MDDEDDDLFSYYAKSGAELRDEGIELVSRNAGQWMVDAYLIVQSLPLDWEGTGEDIRHILIPRIGPAHSDHAYGALVRQCSDKRKSHRILFDTHRIRRMKDPKSHARRTPVWSRSPVDADL